MTIPSIVLLFFAVCMVVAFFGPFQRRFILVLWLGLCLGAGGIALSVSAPYDRWMKGVTAGFAALFVLAYVAHVQQRLDDLARERGAREQDLVQSLSQDLDEDAKGV